MNEYERGTLRKILILAVLAAMLVAVPGAQANHKPSHSPNGPRDCTVNKAFVLKGTFESGDANTVSFDVTSGNRHARRAGFEGDDANGDNDKFTADPTRGPVRYSGYEDGESAEAGDKVRAVGKIVYNRCTGEYGAVTIRSAKVIDGDAEAS